MTTLSTLNETEIAKFARRVKKARNAKADYQNIYDDDLPDYQHFIDHGILLRQVGNTPSELAWWEFVHLRIPERYWLSAANSNFAQTGQLDYASLMRALAYGYVDTARAHYGMHHFLARFGRERSGGLCASDLFQLCIAELAGLSREAKQLFHAFACAYQRGSIIRSNGHVGDLVLLIYARYLGCSEAEFSARVDNFAYPELVASWDTEDLDHLSQLLMSLCDVQARQTLAPPSKFFIEFDNGKYCYWPLTALMVLKLRQNRGLANPELTHPAFGSLNAMLAPTPLALEMDDLLQGILGQMQQQGFDIDAAYALTR
jgi:hypothetical protein